MMLQRHTIEKTSYVVTPGTCFNRRLFSGKMLLFLWVLRESMGSTIDFDEAWEDAVGERWINDLVKQLRRQYECEKKAKKIAFINCAEKFGREKGMKEGELKAAKIIMKARFGSIPDCFLAMLENADTHKLGKIIRELATPDCKEYEYKGKFKVPPYISAFERFGIEEGRKEGELKVAKIIMKVRFGSIPAGFLAMLKNADIHELENIIQELATANYPEDMECFLMTSVKGFSIEKEIEKGREKEKLAVAKNLKEKEIDFPFISEVTGLSIEEIEHL